jgi:hypothetical protein
MYCHSVKWNCVPTETDVTPPSSESYLLSIPNIAKTSSIRA